MKNNNLIVFYQDDINENIIQIEIILKIINKFNMNKLMFSLPDISKWNTNKATNQSAMFYGYESLSSLPYISK